VGFSILSLVSYLVIGSLKEVSIIALAYHAIMINAYFIHERVWNRVSWGRSSGLLVQMTGLSGAGKTTLAMGVAEKLRKKGYLVEVIDGDEYREGLCKDLGFSKEDRNTNIRRLGFVGKILSRNKVVCIMSAINPYDAVRQEVKAMSDNVRTVHVNCDIVTLRQRDPKGLYKRAYLPDGDPDKIHNFTGVSDPYEKPADADLMIQTFAETQKESEKRLYDFIIENT
tara:strand:+ start:242 stop:919 length:678 start_codon:yes stop_codon:yes gene_type:complete